MSDEQPTFTPRETVSELDRYIVGQDKAKKAVAIALRNRWRRRQVSEDLRDEINPKNIIMIGPTGVGKTEIARRLAKLVRHPSSRLTSKFTEVGYVGRDVESMIRDLTDIAINMVKAEQAERIKRPQPALPNRLIELLLASTTPITSAGAKSLFCSWAGWRDDSGIASGAESLRTQLRAGNLDDAEVTISSPVTPNGPSFEILAGSNMDDMMSNLKDALGNLQGMMPGGVKHATSSVPEALRILTEQESERPWIWIESPNWHSTASRIGYHLRRRDR